MSSDKNDQKDDTVEPKVINNEMIREYLVEYNKIHSIFDQDNIPFVQFTHLGLSYKNINLISNLNGMINLEKLQLDNNVICKIENIDHLVNLKWLDLSFNNISKIEGLETLVNLTDLSLYNNQIKIVEGLMTLSLLNFLSLGANKIAQAEQVLTPLKKNKHLQVLIVKDNPFFKDKNTAMDVKALLYNSLKTLKYIDYAIVDEELIKNADEKYKGGDSGGYETKDIKLPDAIAKGSGDEKLDELADSKIGFKKDFFQKIKEDDADLKKLMTIKFPQDNLNKHEEDIKDDTTKFMNELVNQNKKKADLIFLCDEIIAEEEKVSEVESIKFIEEYEVKKKHSLNDIKTLKEKTSILDIFKALKSDVNILESNLLDVEMKHVKRIESQIDLKYKAKMGEITNKMTIDTDKFINELKSTRIPNYNGDLRKLVQNAAEEFTAKYSSSKEIDPEVEKGYDDLALYITDKEGLNHNLENSLTTMLGKVEDMSSKLIKEIREIGANFEANLKDRLQERNRKILIQIIDLHHTLESEIVKLEEDHLKMEEDDS